MSGGPKPEISIIIRSKNEERYIGQTLSAIFQQDIDLPFEVIVIDSGSTDRTLDIVRRHAVRLHAIDANEFSYGRALNFGASLAKGRSVVNLYAHCIPTNRRWIANILSDLQNGPTIAATYGAQVPIKGLNPFEERILMVVFTPDKDGKIGSPFSNANCAVRKEVWKRFPFDETASFAEDFIWSQMLPKEHEIKYAPTAEVYHSHPVQLRYWGKRAYDNGVLAEYIKHVSVSIIARALRRVALPFRGPIGSNSSVPWVGTSLESLHVLVFLLQNRYLKFIPVFPIFFAVEQYCYRRGLAPDLNCMGKLKGPICERPQRRDFRNTAYVQRRALFVGSSCIHFCAENSV